MLSSRPSRALPPAMRRRTGPPMVALTEFDSIRPSPVHTAPVASQLSPPISPTDTSRHEAGITCTRHSPGSIDRTHFTLPPDA